MMWIVDMLFGVHTTFNRHWRLCILIATHWRFGRSPRHPFPVDIPGRQHPWAATVCPESPSRITTE